MGNSIRSLTEICQIKLLRNYQLLDDLGEVRYDLIQRVLDRFTVQQLLNIEKLNPKLILEDEKTWYKKLNQDFPQNVNDRYTSDFEKIRKYFNHELKEMNFQMENLEGYLESFKKKKSFISEQIKFRLPSRLLYLRYKEEKLQREEDALLRLRERMKAQRELKKESEIIHLKEVIPTSKHQRVIYQYPGQYQQSNRSFQTSRHEAINNGRSRIVMPASEPGFHSKKKRSFHQSSTPASIESTRRSDGNREVLSQNNQKTSESTNKISLISSDKDPRPILKSTTTTTKKTNIFNTSNRLKRQRIQASNLSKSSNNDLISSKNCEQIDEYSINGLVKTESVRPYKKIKLSDYLSMKRSSKT